MLKRIESRFKIFFTALLRFLLRSNPAALPSPESIKNILLIRQHNQLGDMLCVVPLLRALRAKYPSAILTLMASPLNYDLMLHNRYIDRVIKYDKKEFLGRFWIRPGPLLRFIRELRAERFDLVLVPSTVSISFTSNLLAYLSGASVRIGPGSIDGAKNGSRFLFNLPVELDWRNDPHRHQTLRNLDIATPLRLDLGDVTCEVTLLGEELERGRACVNQAESIERRDEGVVVAFHPGAGKVPNQWPASRFAEVANSLAKEFGAHLLITSGPMDRQPVSEMTTALNVPYSVIDRRPIREIAAILAHVDLVISNDTGIMHVGAAVGTPVLSLFGPTDSRQWSPVGNKHRSVQAKDGLITSITVDEVLSVARDMLGELTKLIPPTPFSLRERRGSKGDEFST